MNEVEPAHNRRRWVRGRLSLRVAVVAVPVAVVCALIAALGPLGDVGRFLEALVWTVVAAAFGVASAWLLAVMLVPTEAEAVPFDPSVHTRREFRRRLR